LARSRTHFCRGKVTVPYLCTLEQQYVPFVPLASYKTVRTAASIALLDAIVHRCLLLEAVIFCCRLDPHLMMADVSSRNM
jgi:hypothetical protein